MIHSDCLTDSRQFWEPIYVRPSDSAVQFRSVFSGLCLHAVGTSGSMLTQQTCGLGGEQLWLPAGPSSFTTFSSPSGLAFPTSNTPLTSSKLNRFSRHASLVLSPLPTAIDWRLSYSNDTNNQLSCGACSIFAVVASVEGLWARLTGGAQLSLSEQEALDCGGSCGGSWPEAAMDSLASLPNGLATAADYGSYQGVVSSCKAVPGIVKVAAYEQIGPWNEASLLAALSQQPLVAYMTMPENLRMWTSWNIFTDIQRQCTLGSMLSHVVTLVGYGTEGGVDFWIIRSSYGTAWGLGGHSRIQRGICGIGTVNSIYPVLAAPSNNPCGTTNPCGLGTCLASGSSYTCSCPTDFVNLKNTDGTETCVTNDVCGSSIVNPCQAGSCVNEGGGSYHCTCFSGYLLSVNSQGQQICVSSYVVNALLPFNYTFQNGDTCKILQLTFGVTRLQLLAANPLKVCSSLKPGDVLIIPTPLNAGCNTMYSVQKGDSCLSIEIDLALTVGSLALMNPSLDCTDATLSKGQQVCVEKGNPDGNTKLCTAVDFVTAADLDRKRCRSLRKKTVKLTRREFFELNRGINCNNLVVGLPYCLNYQLQAPMACARYYKWRSSDTCSSVIKTFCGSRTTKTWTQCLGSGAGLCIGTGSTWSTGRIICVTTCLNPWGQRVTNCFG